MRNKIVEKKSNSPDVEVHEEKSTEKRGILHFAAAKNNEWDCPAINTSYFFCNIKEIQNL